MNFAIIIALFVSLCLLISSVDAGKKGDNIILQDSWGGSMVISKEKKKENIVIKEGHHKHWHCDDWHWDDWWRR